MSLTPADSISLGGAVATAIGVFVVWRQTEKLTQQLTLQNYSDYTKRYQEIILNFPENVNDPTFSLQICTDKDKTMRYMRAYFDLCFEEWDLHSRKLIEDETWSVWNDGIKKALSKQSFVQAWGVVAKNSKYDTKFYNFISIAIAENTLR